jgi:formiminoglutamase
MTTSLHSVSIDLPTTTPEDPRLGHLLRPSPADLNSPDALADLRVALIGFPSDEGVRRNLGRPGAAEGPTALRRWLYRMTPDPQHPDAFTALLAQTADLGDVPCGPDLEASQETLGHAVARLRTAHTPPILPILLGGGHEVAFGHFLGHALAHEPITLLNIDAHLDVRPLRAGLAHSGSPFRQALEHPSGMARGYVALGLEPSAVAPAHAAWALDHGASLSYWPDTTYKTLTDALDHAPHPVMAGIDIDAVSAAYAPGVSAPRASGLSARLICDMAEALGRSPRVVGLHIAELSPPHDIDGRTARLCALVAWRFLRGVMLRIDSEA